MHMHMLWRADAGVDRIDIGDKVTGHELLVNAISSLRQSISSMKRPWGVWGGAKHSPQNKDAGSGLVASMGRSPRDRAPPHDGDGKSQREQPGRGCGQRNCHSESASAKTVIPRSFVRPGDEESAGAGAEAADPSGPCVPESL